MLEGSDPGARDTACIEIAVLKAVDVTLDRPLGDRRLVDGANTEPSGGPWPSPGRLGRTQSEDRAGEGGA